MEQYTFKNSGSEKHGTISEHALDIRLGDEDVCLTLRL